MPGHIATIQESAGGTTITIVDPKTWRSRALEDLQQLGQRAARLQIGDPATLSFSLSELSDDDRVRELCRRMSQQVKAKTPVIYCFEFEDLSCAAELRNAFDGRQQMCETTGEKFRYSRVNKPAATTALYVGSSQSFPSRFSQHLGRTGGAKTYSMRLAQWASTVAASIEVSIWTFENGIGQAVLELYEQALWDLKQPLLGKRSGK